MKRLIQNDFHIEIEMDLEKSAEKEWTYWHGFKYKGFQETTCFKQIFGSSPILSHLNFQ